MRPPVKRAPIGGVNITSLCDVMLSLLIFFMLVSKAGIDTGADPDIELPTARLGITEDDLQRERDSGSVLLLNVDASGVADNPRVYGRLFATGREFDVLVRSPTTGRAELREFVREVRGTRDDFVVQIHAPAGTPMFSVEPVLQAVSAANPARVDYAFTRPN